MGPYVVEESVSVPVTDIDADRAALVRERLQLETRRPDVVFRVPRFLSSVEKGAGTSCLVV